MKTTSVRIAYHRPTPPDREFVDHLPTCDTVFYSESSSSSITPHRAIPTFAFGLPDAVPYDSIRWTRSSPSMTSPKTTCLPSRCDVTAVVMKN